MLENRSWRQKENSQSLDWRKKSNHKDLDHIQSKNFQKFDPYKPPQRIQPYRRSSISWHRLRNRRSNSSNSSFSRSPYRDSVSSKQQYVAILTNFTLSCPHSPRIVNSRIELIRCRKMDTLRKKYQKLCYNALGWSQSPKESFNRWIFERNTQITLAFRKNNKTRIDPLIPDNTYPQKSTSMRREIIEDLPCKTRPPLQFVGSDDIACKYLEKYVQGILNLLNHYQSENFNMWYMTISEPDDTRFSSHDASCSIKLLKTMAEESLQWLADPGFEIANGQSCTNLEIVLDYIKSVKKKCHPHLESLFSPVADRLCNSIRDLCHESALDVAKQSARIEAANIHSITHTRRTATEVKVTSQGVTFSLTCVHYDKLWNLYNKHRNKNCSERPNRSATTDDSRKQEFHNHLWCLLCRYNSFCGQGRFEGSGHQGSLPSSVFQHLYTVLGVSFECFASPFNCQLPNYCSAFADTDTPFGSSGSFFDLDITSGSYEANPPFSEELMDSMATHMFQLLRKSTDPLSFLIVVPNWTDPPSPALTRLNNSPFLRYSTIVPENKHTYVDGFQHLPHKKSLVYIAVHSSRIFIIQNDAGYKKWTPTKTKLEEIKNTWMKTLSI